MLFKEIILLILVQSVVVAASTYSPHHHHRLIEVILETDLCISVCLFRHFHCFIISLFLTWNTTGVVLLFMNLYVHSFLIMISICFFLNSILHQMFSWYERCRDVFYLFSWSFFVPRTLFGIIMNALPYHNNYWFVQCCSSLMWNYRAILFFKNSPNILSDPVATAGNIQIVNTCRHLQYSLLVEN